MSVPSIVNQKEKKERIHYMDIAKGILICLVIIHHVPQLAKNYIELDGHFWWDVKSLNLYYAGYFMQTFFVITGFCSNFEHDFKSFFTQNFKSVLVPGILLPLLISCIICGFRLEFHPYQMIMANAKQVLLFGSWSWFLPTLFVAKMIYWAIWQYKKSYIFSLITGCILLLFGSIINAADLIPNYWMHRHALSMVVFIALGHTLKKKKDVYHIYLYGTVLFFLLMTSIKIIGIKTCWITNSYHVAPYEIPLHLLICYSGTCLILLLSMLIEKNRLLEYIGRNSLIIYVFQFEVIRYSFKMVQDYIPTLVYKQEIALFVAIFIITLIIPLCFNIILKTKYLQFFLGKF